MYMSKQIKHTYSAFSKKAEATLYGTTEVVMGGVRRWLGET